MFACIKLHKHNEKEIENLLYFLCRKDPDAGETEFIHE